MKICVLRIQFQLIFLEPQKFTYLIYFWLEVCFFYFFANSNIDNVILKLPKVVKLYFENKNVNSTFSNVIHINFEINIADLMLIQHCKFQSWHTQCCFNIYLALFDVVASYQPTETLIIPILIFVTKLNQLKYWKKINVSYTEQYWLLKKEYFHSPGH